MFITDSSLTEVLGIWLDPLAFDGDKMVDAMGNKLTASIHLRWCQIAEPDWCPAMFEEFAIDPTFRTYFEKN